jgi:hypothetical protein
LLSANREGKGREFRDEGREPAVIEETLFLKLRFMWCQGGIKKKINVFPAPLDRLKNDVATKGTKNTKGEREEAI